MAAPPAVGGVMPAQRIEGGPVPDSLWALWTGGHAHHAAFRNARSALAALLRQRGVRRIWFPDYICRQAVSAAQGVEVAWAPVDAALTMTAALLSQRLAPGDAVLGIDYFGRSPPPAFRDLAAARREVLWIEDRAQALAPDAAPWGDVLLYSPRKLAGVADGGLMVSDTPLPSPRLADPSGEAALWVPEDARAQDPEGRNPADWYPLFQTREAGLAVDDAAMSPRSEAALRRLPAAPIIARRRENYARLLAALPDYALWPDTRPTFAPMVFPVLVEDRDTAVTQLAALGLYCPQHWADLPSPRATSPEAWRTAEHILSLPCDQRYGEADMDRLAKALRAVGRPLRRA